jgi:hypothetical protein
MMAYKLLRMTQERWRRLDGAELLPLVRAGVPFIDGGPVEREDQKDVKRVGLGEADAIQNRVRSVPDGVRSGP